MSGIAKAVKNTVDIDAAAEAALWLKGLKDTNNKSFIPLFFDEHRYLVLMGGGGSGKSIFAGRKIIERAVSEEGHRILVCRKVGKSIRESCFHQLISQIEQYYPTSGYSVNNTDMRIRFPNRSEILFSGLDDVEKLKSIHDITAIWIEEASELLETDFSQLDIRLRGETKYYQQIILSFNPISALHWLKKRFFDTEDPRARTHRSTYKDNRFLDANAIITLEAFKDTDPYYYNVYCLGEWGVTGQTVFPAAKVVERLANIPKALMYDLKYAYDGNRVFDCEMQDTGDEYGDIEVYKLPEDGIPYVMGVDTSGDGSDYSVAQVLNNITGEQVASVRCQHMDEDLFAHNIAALGYIYNTALVGVECNFSTYVVRELERIQYPSLYVRENMDNYTHRMKQSFGFVTTSANRSIIIANLVTIVRDDIELISSRATLEEMLTFVRNEAGRPEAEQNAHDDCIMSLAIAYFIRPQGRSTIRPVENEKVEWTRDMWEDYWNAKDDERQYLIKKWGEPKY